MLNRKPMKKSFVNRKNMDVESTGCSILSKKYRINTGVDDIILWKNWRRDESTENFDW